MIHARDDYNRIQDPAGLIPTDEPVFLLRAQDALACAAVAYYADLCEQQQAPAIALKARAHAERMMAWPKKKIPDLPAEPEPMTAQQALERQREARPVPTTWPQRFTQALTVLCGEAPPVATAIAWFEPGCDSIELLDWVGEHCRLSWAQGIVAIEAAEMLANAPEEGAGHVGRTSQQQALDHWRKVHQQVRELWNRDDDATFDLLSLVGGHAVPREAITGWTDEQCLIAEQWATNRHLAASGNNVKFLLVPEHVKAWPEPARSGSVDCGECPRISTGCPAGACLRAADRSK